MKFFFCTLWFLFSLSTLHADTDRLVLGFDDWPPFTGRDGSPRVAVDLLEEAMERLNKNVDMIQLPPGEFSRLFTDRRIEASPALWMDGERKKTMIFSDPVFENRLMLVGRKGSGAAEWSLEDLEGKKLAVVGGYSYGERLENSPATLVEGVGDQVNMVKLLNGEVDAVIMGELLLTYARRVQREQFEARLEIGREPQITRAIHIAVKKSVPGAKKLVRALNAELKAMLKDGTYHEIMGVGRLVKDVDGDGNPEVITVGDPANTLNPQEVYADASGSTDVPAGMRQWYLVEGKLYASLEQIPEDQRKRMHAPKQTADFEFIGF